jgi:hypothetical protein
MGTRDPPYRTSGGFSFGLITHARGGPSSGEYRRKFATKPAANSRWRRWEAGSNSFAERRGRSRKCDYALGNRPSTGRGKWAAGCFPNAPGALSFLQTPCGARHPQLSRFQLDARSFKAALSAMLGGWSSSRGHPAACRSGTLRVLPQSRVMTVPRGVFARPRDRGAWCGS